MLLLTGSSDAIHLITETAAPIDVQASFMDNLNGVVTPGRTNTNISSATTTEIVGSPAAGVQRNVQTLIIRNTDGVSANTVVVRHTDGATAVLMARAVLTAHEYLQYVDGDGWAVFTASGARKNSESPAPSVSVEPTSAQFSALSQSLSVETANRISADNVLSVAISALSQALSLRTSVLSAAIDAETSNRLSADNVLSNAISAGDAALSGRITSVDNRLNVVSTASGATSVQGLQSVVNALSTRIDVAGGGGSVTSNELSAAVAAETSNRISADNALSNAISVLSQQLSLQVSALSQRISSLSVGGLKGVSAPTPGDGQVLMFNLSAGLWQASAVAAGTGSVTSAELIAGDNAVSAQAASAVAAETSNRVSADNTLSNAISVLSQQLSLTASALSARIDTVSNATSSGDAALSARINSVVTSVTMGNVALTSLFDIAAVTVPTAAPTSAIRLHGYNRLDRMVLQYKTPANNRFQVCQDNVVVMRNETGLTIPAFRCVYESGTGAGGEPLIAQAQANSQATMPAIGITIEPIANGANGFVMYSGVITDQNTSGFSAGDILYVSEITPGILTTTAPPHPNLRQRIVRVLNSSATDGAAIVTNVGVRGDHQGTNLNNWLIGDNAAGTKALVFRNGADLSLQASPTVGRTISIPDADGILALQADVDAASAQAASAIASETSNRISADNALSNAISVLSSRLSTVSTASGATSVQGLQSVINALSTRIDGVGGGGSVTSAELVAGDNAVSAQAASAVSVLSALVSNTISDLASVKARVASVDARVTSVLSTDISNLRSATSTLSTNLSAEIANRISADNVLSNAISVLSQQLSLQVSALSQALSVGDAALSARITSVLSTDISNLRSATSTLSTNLSAEIANRISADNVLSNAISAVSQQLSLQISALAQTVSVADAALSARITSVLSVDISDLRSVDARLSNLISQIRSVDISNLRSATSTLSTNLSAEIANRISADNVLSNAISVLSAQLSLQVSALSQRISALSVGGLKDVSAPAPGDQQVLMWKAASVQWVASTPPAGGGGSVTSAEVYNLVSNEASIRSAADAALSIRIDAIPGGASAPAIGFVSTTQSLTQSTITTTANISGLAVSVSAGGIYQVFAMMIANKATVAGGGLRLGMNFPNMANTRGLIVANISAFQGGMASNNIWGWNGNSASDSILVSVVSANLLSIAITWEGIFVVNTGGVIQLRAAAATPNAGAILRGSFIRAVKIN